MRDDVLATQRILNESLTSQIETAEALAEMRPAPEPATDPYEVESE